MTTNVFFTIWGCGKGRLRGLQPHVRILSGALLGCACITAPLPSIHGTVFVVTIALVWWALAGMPGAMTIRTGIAALILFAPVLLLTPWITDAEDSVTPWIERLAHAGAIALKSACCLFVAASTVAVLPQRDVHRGLAALPLPRSIAMLIIQLVTQTMLLAEETLRIVAALRIRAAAGLRVVFSFPVVWMGRILFRAERTAAAMTVRGYGIETASPERRSSLTPPDLLTITASAAIFASSLFMRWGIFT